MGEPWADLNEFCFDRLAGSKYPDCSHRFRMVHCEACKGTELRLNVERHDGDRPGDFQGLLRYACALCDEGAGTITGSVAMKPAAILSVEDWACAGCGHDIAFVGSMDRWEDWGFFDEGTVAARCCKCGAIAAVVDTD